MPENTESLDEQITILQNKKAELESTRIPVTVNTPPPAPIPATIPNFAHFAAITSTALQSGSESGVADMVDYPSSLHIDLPDSLKPDENGITPLERRLDKLEIRAFGEIKGWDF